MSDRNNLLFKGLYIVAWIIFVGLSIEAGALIVNFIFSIYKPEFIPNLYQKLDLTPMYHQSIEAFFTVYSFVLVIAILKAGLFYIVIRLMHKLDLSRPFSNFASRQILQLSYYTFAIGLLSYIARQTVKQIQKKQYAIDSLNQFWADSDAFILMAAVIYIIAVIFKKGVDLQNENDLTV